MRSIWLVMMAKPQPFMQMALVIRIGELLVLRHRMELLHLFRETVIPLLLNSQPLSGVFGLNSFWKQSPTATAAYKALRLILQAITEIDAGLSITAEDRLNANQASIEQIKLDAGEKVLFAIHRGTDANPVGEDAINASIHIDLLASQKVIGGKEYYYNLNNGHYLGLSSGEATWSTAATEVELLDLEGNQVYLSTRVILHLNRLLKLFWQMLV